jgi:phosphoribosylanthranilate isomerase
MPKIKICGLSRSRDADSVNEALPDYAGFVVAQSPWRVAPLLAEEIKAADEH